MSVSAVLLQTLASAVPGLAIIRQPPSSDEQLRPDGASALAPAEQAAGAALTPGESSELASCEEIIERGLRTFIEVGAALTTIRDQKLEVGAALTTIRDQKLYRAQYGTFALYVEQRWGMKARQAQRLMVGAEIANNILAMASADNAAPGSPLLMPSGERLARPLAALPPQQRRSAWLTAVETAPGGRPTAKHVERVVALLLGNVKAEVGESKTEVPGPKPKPVVDLLPAGTREELLDDAADEAIDKIRELMELIGDPDSMATADVVRALEPLNEFKRHLSKMQALQEARR